MFYSHVDVSISLSLLKKIHKIMTIGTSHNILIGQLTLVPRFVFLIVGAGLDVSC